jgi:thiamine-phosphate pyrophosphorylase
MTDSFGLYLVLTRPRAGYEACTEAAVDAGVRFVQLRMKDEPREDVVRTARRLVAIVRGTATKLVVNDDPSVAAEVGADGVHVGQDDVSLVEARRILGRGGTCVGLSTHDEDQARRAESLAPTYIGVGPVFPTPTKRVPDPVLGLERAARIIRGTRLIAVAIGGIDASNLPGVLAAGIRNFAVVRHVCGSDAPSSAIRELLAIHRSQPASRTMSPP